MREAAERLERIDARRRLVFVFGTRPEAIKLAPVIKSCERDARFDVVVLVARQHDEILDQALEAFAIRPHRAIELERNGHALGELTAKGLVAVQGVLDELAPDLVVVQGDTTTAFVAALAAFYAGVPVAHVEAGLRTRDLGHPFPEELNRQMIARIAALHFAPTRLARLNLVREGVPAEQIVITGNTIIDALRVVRPSTAAHETGRRRLLATAHRRENWGGPLAEICAALRDLAREIEDLDVLFVVHPNPLVRRAAIEALRGVDNVTISPPLPYRRFIEELARTEVVLTDSGGVQEEAPFFGVPVVVLRETTERVEGVQAGNATIAGTSRESIRAAALEVLSAARRTGAREGTSPYGDGQAAERIVRALRHYFSAPVLQLVDVSEGNAAASTSA